jgi:hypothetical protein
MTGPGARWRAAASALILGAPVACSGSPGGDDARSTDGGSAPALDATDAGTAAEAEATVTVNDASRTSAPIEVQMSTDAPGPGRLHSSPSIVAGGIGRVVVAAFDDTDEDITHHVVGWSRSTDDGASFTDQGSLPGMVSPDGVADVGFPCVARDAVIGNVYVASVGRVAQAAIADGSARPPAYNALAFFVSANAGVSFSPAVNGADPNLAADDYTDFPTIAVDNAPGFSQGVVYIAYADFVGGGTEVKLRLSTYVNHSFAVTEVVSPEPGDEASLPSVAVSPDHDVWIAYYSQIASAPAIAVVRSTDQGQHFGPPVVVAPLHLSLAAGSFDGDLGLQGQRPDGTTAPVGMYPSPQIAANPVTGALSIVYVDAAANDRANVYFVHSEDGGATWSTPLRVNDDATTNDQFLPSIAVSPDGTRLAVGFDDRRNDAANMVVERFAATAAVSGSTITFEPNFRVSAAPSPVLVGSDPYLKPDYFSIRSTMTTDGDFFYDAYADARSGNLEVHLARFGVAY